MKIQKYAIITLPLFVFAFSFVLQHGFDFKPCNLCIVARYCFLALFIACFVRNKCLIFLVLILGIGVAIYHKLVQYGVFSQCHIFGNYENEGDFFKMMQNAVPCTAKTIIFGIDAVYFNIAFFAIYIFIFATPKLRKFFFN